MGYWSDFRSFAARGNVLDLAVGVMVGGAFGKVVSSLVDNVLAPPLGLAIGGVDFSQLRATLKPAGPDGRGEVAIGYGLFLQSVVNFLIVAVALYALARGLRWLERRLEGRRSEEAAGATPAPASPPEDVRLLAEIRDLLKAGARNASN